MRKEQPSPSKFYHWGLLLRLTVTCSERLKSHQDPPCPSLPGDQLPRPVLGAGHEVAALPPLGPLLLLHLLLLVGRAVVHHLPAEHGGTGPDEEDREDSDYEGEDGGEEETPPLPLL